MNKSLSTGIFVDEWKMAKVFPIFKSGDVGDVNNYRPVSIFPILSKFIERHVHGALFPCLHNHKLLYLYQSGFRPRHSCETELNNMVDNWMKNMDTGKSTGLLHIDLRKAFDTVSHTILLHKFTANGIHGAEWIWFKDYLNNRKQAPSWQEELSEFGLVTVGVCLAQSLALCSLFYTSMTCQSV